MPQCRAFDRTTGTLRFTVPLEQGHVTAYLSEAIWQARFGSGYSDSSFIEIYIANQPMIESTVVRKVNAGARSPVVLNAGDL